MRVHVLLSALFSIIILSSASEDPCENNYGEIISTQNGFVDCTNCPVGTIYHQRENSCVSQASVFSEDVDITEICAGVFFSARPYPDDNRLYVGCIRGFADLLQCFENEIFDADLLECVEFIPETTTSQESTFSSTISVIESSSTTESITISFTSESTPISLTDSTTSELITSTESTTASEIITSPESTTFTLEASTTPESTTTSEFITLPPNPCAGIQNGRVPYPGDCTRCHFCFYFQILDVDCICPEGQIFVINDCVTGDPDTCQPSAFM